MLDFQPKCLAKHRKVRSEQLIFKYKNIQILFVEMQEDYNAWLGILAQHLGLVLEHLLLPS